jgi:hypothetical protein
MLSRRSLVLIVLGASAAAFLGWRLLRPMNIFVVSPAFERPIDTAAAPAILGTLRAQDCGACHRTEYAEWRTSVHSRAWSEAYFQVDWRFDGSQQICKNCHIPLDRQQEGRVLGFRDADKWQPLLERNASFDASLQHEGVTCAACHLREGKVLAPPGAGGDAPHPLARLADANEICLRCHVVQGERWDTFYRFPPCGTASEISAAQGARQGRSGEFTVRNVAELGCVQCHMPAVERPLVDGGKPRAARQHLWRGGHDPATVRAALAASLSLPENSGDRRAAEFSLTNVGANHYLPTGTPDRHLTVRLRALDAGERVLREETHVLERTIMWRPFIVDLWDTRLPRGEARRYRMDLPAGTAAVDAQVSYHLLGEARRKRIGYQPAEPISYVVLEERRSLARP